MEKLETKMSLQARIPCSHILQINIVQQNDIIKPYVLYISQESVVKLFKCNHKNYPDYKEITKVMNSKHFNYLGYFEIKNKIFFKNKEHKINNLAIMLFTIILKNFYTADSDWKIIELYKLSIKVNPNDNVNEQHTQERIKCIEDVKIEQRTSRNNWPSKNLGGRIN